MKLLIENNRILATATDDYVGNYETLVAPEYFDATRIGDYVISDGVPVIPPLSAKEQREIAVSNIIVTTATGNEFDGDEVSQTRMARAIIGLQAAGLTTIDWTLANNQTVPVTLAELTEALILAGQEQSALWTI